jgi:threonine aldolase
MANLAAIMAWCPNRGSEILLGDKSHIYLYEQAGASQIASVSPRILINNADGTFDINAMVNSIRGNNIHYPTTNLICIENTHNACGGRVLPLSFLESLSSVSKSNNIPIHMDGARIWNAAEHSKMRLHEIANFVDSVSVCLSKGLGAPAGSILLGPKEFIERAKRARKVLGGGMRQSGVLGEYSDIACEEFIECEELVIE